MLQNLCFSSSDQVCPATRRREETVCQGTPTYTDQADKARMAEIKTALTEVLAANHTRRYQRDQARVRVEYLEQKHNEDPRTVWPTDTLVGLP
ncbi:hypothetical protein ACFFLM_04060 [Deinococcus oregonensis]|uniref:Uncharacterized protein n=1 Tax=Deinococcus oregonensis TaxID=1805970 RepID=A0ABV6AUH4_9DEIO